VSGPLTIALLTRGLAPWLIGCAPPAPTSPALQEHEPATPDRPDVELRPTETSTSASGLVINEVMPANDSTVMDADRRFPDWLELYNGGHTTIDLSRVTLRDTSGDPWIGQGELAPGDHLLLWADDTEGAADRLPFKLSADGETLELLVDGRIEDRIDTGPLSADVAWGRFPDGGAWSHAGRSTPGYANGSHPADPDPSAVFFGPTVTDIYLYISESAKERLNVYGEWAEGSLRFEGAWLPQVDVRLKGHGSYEDLSGKSAFKIDLNEFESDQRLRGLKALTLNNAKADPTWTHEYLTYSLFRALDYPAPRTGWSRVHVNDELYGLYINVETWDDVMLDRWFDDADAGTLWEGSGDFGYGENDDQSKGSPIGPDYSINPGEYEEGPYPPDETVIEAVRALMLQPPTDAAVAELSLYVELDAFLTYMALEAMVMFWDGYQKAHNWRFYQDALTRRLMWLPTGADATWTLSKIDPWEVSGDVLDWCLGNAGCYSDYSERVVEVSYATEALGLVQVFDEVSVALEEDMVAEPRGFHTAELIAQQQALTRENLEGWPAALREVATAKLEE